MRYGKKKRKKETQYTNVELEKLNILSQTIPNFFQFRCVLSTKNLIFDMIFASELPLLILNSTLALDRLQDSSQYRFTLTFLENLFKLHRTIRKFSIHFI